VERRLARTLMPRFHAGFSVGTVAGALLGAAAAGVGLAVQVQLALTGVASLAAVAVCLRAFLPVVADAVDAPAALRVSQAWRESRTLLVGVLVLCFAFVEGTANDWLAIALVDGHGTSDAVGALGFACFVAAMTASRTVGGSLLTRYGRTAVLRATALLSAAGLLLVVLSSALPVVLLGALLWGAGAALGFPVGMSAAADDEVGAAVRVSVVSSIGYTAFLAGPPLVGLLAEPERLGVLRALLVVFVALLVGAAVARFAAPLRSRSRPPPAGDPHRPGGADVLVSGDDRPPRRWRPGHRAAAVTVVAVALGAGFLAGRGSGRDEPRALTQQEQAVVRLSLLAPGRTAGRATARVPRGCTSSSATRGRRPCGSSGAPSAGRVAGGGPRRRRAARRPQRGARADPAAGLRHAGARRAARRGAAPQRSSADRGARPDVRPAGLRRHVRLRGRGRSARLRPDDLGRHHRPHLSSALRGRAPLAVAPEQALGGAVERTVPSASPCSRATRAVASVLPSSTPHWSKELTPHSTPCVSTLCSYAATSCPSVRGVSADTRSVLLGRLPGNVRCGTSPASTPAASTSSAVRPKASACVCARQLASSTSCWSSSPLSGATKAIMSHGTGVVPWCSSW
jgi:MFS family permease